MKTSDLFVRCLEVEGIVCVRALLPFLLFLLRASGDLASEETGVAASEIDGDLSTRRKHTPDAPEVGTCALLVGLAVRRVHVQIARVEPLVQPVQQLVAAGPVVARDHEDHGDGRGAQLVLRLQKLEAQVEDLCLELLLLDLLVEFRGLEHLYLR